MKAATTTTAAAETPSKQVPIANCIVATGAEGYLQWKQPDDSCWRGWLARGFQDACRAFLTIVTIKRQQQ